jgi:hypothetical protein
MSLKGDVIAVTIGGAVLLAAAWYAKKKAGELATTVADNLYDAAQYVNPMSDQNLAYQGVSAFTRWLTGNTNGDLGTITWDYVHKGDPIPGAVADPKTGLTPAYNYSTAQQEADLRAIRQLESGFHGM